MILWVLAGAVVVALILFILDERRQTRRMREHNRELRLLREQRRFEIDPVDQEIWSAFRGRNGFRRDHSLTTERKDP